MASPPCCSCSSAVCSHWNMGLRSSVPKAWVIFVSALNRTKIVCLPGGFLLASRFGRMTSAPTDVWAGWSACSLPAAVPQTAISASPQWTQTWTGDGFSWTSTILTLISYENAATSARTPAPCGRQHWHCLDLEPHSAVPRGPQEHQCGAFHTLSTCFCSVVVSALRRGWLN